MMSRSSFLKDRIFSGKTVWAAGAYDALSALHIAEAGFDAVSTTGFGISAALLGEPDAELYTMSENVGVVRNIASAVSLPVIADADTGYGNAINVMRTTHQFEQAGVSGIILEDQISPKRCPLGVDAVEVLPIEEGAAKIRAAVAARRDPNMLIIARTDVHDPAEAIRRGRAYVAAGADMVQPVSRCFRSFDGLREMRKACGVPMSLQLLSWLETGLTPAEIEEVAALATFTFVPLMTVRQALKDNLAALMRTKKASDFPVQTTKHSEFSDFIGFPRIEKLQEEYLSGSKALSK